MQMEDIPAIIAFLLDMDLPGAKGMVYPGILEVSESE